MYRFTQTIRVRPKVNSLILRRKNAKNPSLKNLGQTPCTPATNDITQWFIR